MARAGTAMKSSNRKEPQYVRTAAEVCKLLEISATTFENWQKDPDFAGRFKIRRGKCGWPITKLRNFFIHKKEKSRSSIGGDHADKKGIKLDEEIRGLRIKNDTAEGLVIPMEEHLNEVRALAQLLTRSFDEFREFALVITKNPALVEKLEQLEDRIRLELAERVEYEDSEMLHLQSDETESE